MIDSVPIFVITKSTGVVSLACRARVGNNKSSRIGRLAEWPGLAERGKGPRPGGGVSGSFVASIVNWFCAVPTRSTQRKKSRNRATIEYKRFITTLGTVGRIDCHDEVYSPTS